MELLFEQWSFSLKDEVLFTGRARCMNAYGKWIRIHTSCSAREERLHFERDTSFSKINFILTEKFILKEKHQRAQVGRASWPASITSAKKGRTGAGLEQDRTSWLSAVYLNWMKNSKIFCFQSVLVGQFGWSKNSWSYFKLIVFLFNANISPLAKCQQNRMTLFSVHCQKWVLRTSEGVGVPNRQ